jgi:hypothetical protein
VISAFDIARCLALGADWCNSARGFMFALGCIQSRSCHTDHCPTGVATQDPVRQRAIVVTDKAERVFYFHANTLHALADLVGAAGLKRPGDITPHHLMVRHAHGNAKSLAASIETLEAGALLSSENTDNAADTWPNLFAEFWPSSSADRWGVSPA